MTWHLVSDHGTRALRAGGEYVIGSAEWCDVVVNVESGPPTRHLIVRIDPSGLHWSVLKASDCPMVGPDGPLDAARGAGELVVQFESPSGPLVALTQSPGLSLASAARPTWPRPKPTGDVTTYGRAKDNDVVLDGLLVSPHHAEVSRQAGRFLLTDLGSARGTFVNGERVKTRELSIGDWVTIGGQPFRVDGDGRLEAVALRNGVTVEVRGVTVRAGDSVLVDNVSFGIPRRSLVAVIGPSGSGKSTLLGALTGLNPASEGEVIVGGQNLYDSYAEWRYRIGFVPQQDLVPAQLTIAEAMTYAARLRFPSDTTEDERQNRIDAVLAELKLAERADLRIDKLSGGQRKRVSVALELLTRPTILCLDEPTSGLDPGLDQQLMMLLRELVEEGRTVVVVTHSMDNLDLCDRVLLLAPGGHIAYYGPPQEALAYFNARTWPEVFLALEQQSGEAWGAQFSNARRQRHTGKPKAPTRSKRQEALVHRQVVRPTSPLRQWVTLMARTVRSTLSDRAYLALLVALPIVLAGLGFLVGTSDGLGVGAPPTGLNPDARILILVLILGATFTGGATSISEMIKERVIYHRERAVGLSRTAYVMSKVVVLGVIAAVQGAVFAALTLVGRPGPDNSFISGWGTLDAVAVISALAFTSCMLGLLLSSLLPSRDAALPALVIVTMVQVVLSGAVPLRWDWIQEFIGPLVPASWAFQALASLTDLSALLGPAAETNWSVSSLATLVPLGVLAAMSAALIVLTIIFQAKADPGRSRMRRH